MGVNVFPVRALAPNHIWTLDFVADRLSHGGRLRMLSVLDEFTRECLTVHVERSLKAKDVQEALEKVMKERGAPCDRSPIVVPFKSREIKLYNNGERVTGMRRIPVSGEFSGCLVA
jgi:transposase InsO family protein